MQERLQVSPLGGEGKERRGAVLVRFITAGVTVTLKEMALCFIARV